MESIAIPAATRTRLMVLACVVMAVALSTCGGEGPRDDPNASATPRSPTETAVATSPPAVADESPDLEFFAPHGIAVGPDGSVYVADTDRSRVLRVADGGRIATFAGEADMHGFRGDGGPAGDALLNGPTGLTVDSSGNLFIVDHGNSRVRKVDRRGIITTVVGSGTPGSTGDGGPATEARLQEPLGIAVDRSGRILVADRDNYRVRAVDAEGVITTLAGNGDIGPGRTEGPATEVAFGLPVGVAAGPDESVLISDEPAHRIYKVDADRNISPFAGTGKAGYSGDGGPATAARLNGPYHLASDATGNLYFADAANHAVRVVDRKGTIRTVAGTGKPGARGDGGPADRARLNEPYAVAVDAAGAVYITDTGNSRVRRVSPTGTIRTIVP